MTNWRSLGWCDVCEITLGNGYGEFDEPCPECGFDPKRAQAEREAEEQARQRGDRE